MLVQKEHILTIIPQRPPFVMVDALINIDDAATETCFTITTDNILVEAGQFTEAGLMENIAQTAAAGIGYLAMQTKEPVLVGYIGAVKNLEIIMLPNVNNIINTRVIIVNKVFDITIIAGEITCNNMLVAKCEMKIFTKQ